MKKFVRFLLVLILIVIAAVLILARIEPNDILVSRHILIKAPKDSVFEQVVKFKNWTNWSPWYKMEPGMKITYSCTDGQPGSSYHWVGDDKKTGEGEMTTSAINDSEMDFDVHYTKPYEGNASGILKTEDTAGMTKATWSLTMHTPTPFNAMNIFMNMDKMLGGDFENGLSNLKQYVEGRVPPAPVIEIKEVDYPAHLFEGLRKTISWADMAKFFSDSYKLVRKDDDDNINGHQAGIFYAWDTANKQADLFAGFPVSDTADLIDDDDTFTYAGPAKAAMAVEIGSYSRSMQYHNALRKYMAGKGKKLATVIEEYMIGPKQDPDSNKWVTNIYYLEQ
jgi:effector-binding domain-containing protein